VALVDEETQKAVARSFLRKLPSEVVENLLAEGERNDYPAGTVVYREAAAPRSALVVKGLFRVYLSSPEGRQVTVRYAGPGRRGRNPRGRTQAGSHQRTDYHGNGRLHTGRGEDRLCVRARRGHTVAKRSCASRAPADRPSAASGYGEVRHSRPVAGQFRWRHEREEVSRHHRDIDSSARYIKGVFGARGRDNTSKHLEGAGAAVAEPCSPRHACHGRPLDVPFYVLQGAHDFAAPPDLAERYFEGLIAPAGKQFVLFEASAHYVNYEEPDKFREVLKRVRCNLEQADGAKFSSSGMRA
jgi:hypothetical protein